MGVPRCESENLLVVGVDYDETTGFQWPWSYVLDGPAHGRDIALDGVTGPTGDLYVVGASESESGAVDAIAVRLTLDGDEVWQYRHALPGQGSTEDMSLTVDDDGNARVVGVLIDGTGHKGAWRLTLDEDGQLVDHVEITGLPLDGEEPAWAGLDTDGDIWVAGTAPGTGDDPGDVWIGRYHGNGAEGWTKTYSPAPGLGDRFEKAVLWPAGGVCVGAASINPERDDLEDATFACFDADGTLMGEHRVDTIPECNYEDPNQPDDDTSDDDTTEDDDTTGDDTTGDDTADDDAGSSDDDDEDGGCGC